MLRPFAFALFFAGLAPAQAPRIGAIDFYGLRKLPQSRVRQALRVKEGDPLPPSKGDVEERLDALAGVVGSHLEAVCCDQGKVVLYVGIEERGAPHFDLREAPEEELRLPDEITADYHQLLQALAVAVRLGQDRDDLTHGHSLSANPEARAIQEQFVSLAGSHLKELRDVLRNSADEEQRATAAYVIGYAPEKAAVVDDLQYALRDADAGVRNNAIRSLAATAVLARLDPDSNVRISPTWFIEMLNSLSWTDRNKALMALQILTDQNDPSVLDQLRERALTSLVEMARWKSLEHALPAYLLLSRIAGVSEAQAQQAWTRGDREAVISQALSGKKR